MAAASSSAAAVPDLQSPKLPDDVIARQRELAAADASHDHGAGWSTAGGGVLTRALKDVALTEDGFVRTFSVPGSGPDPRYNFAAERLKAQYNVPFYPKTDTWSPGFVFKPFGPAVKSWLTVHDAGSAHPGQQPCLTWNLVDTASRLRSKASNPLYCKLPNIFLSGEDIGVNTAYVETIVLYGFSEYTQEDVPNTAGLKGDYRFSDQADGGKVKCKTLVKMDPTGRGNFAWYDLTDTETTSRPQTFKNALGLAKWKVLNTNAGYFMGNNNSEALFTVGESREKVLLATLAKLIGDMMTAVGSSKWVKQFHPGGDMQISLGWIPLWRTNIAPPPGRMNILGESGDRLAIYQISDRNGAALYTGSRQDASKMQTATFTPSDEGIDPATLLAGMRAKLEDIKATIDGQFSAFLETVNKYVVIVEGDSIEEKKKLFPMVYDRATRQNYDYVQRNLLTYLTRVQEDITNAYEQAKRRVDPFITDALAKTELDEVTRLHNLLAARIVNLMPQNTSLFIGKKLALTVQLIIIDADLASVLGIEAKTLALRDNPRVIIDTIGVRASYGSQKGGGVEDETLEAFGFAVRVPFPLDDHTNPSFVQLCILMGPPPPPPPHEEGEAPKDLDFEALKPIPSDAGRDAAIRLLKNINQTIERNEYHVHLPLWEKWVIMVQTRMPGADIRDVNRRIEQTPNGDYDVQLFAEIMESEEVCRAERENDALEKVNVAKIRAAAVKQLPPEEYEGSIAEERYLLGRYFIGYGSRPSGLLDIRYHEDIHILDRARAFREARQRRASAGDLLFLARAAPAAGPPPRATTGPGPGKYGFSGLYSEHARSGDFPTEASRMNKKRPADAEGEAAAAAAEVEAEESAPRALIRRRRIGVFGLGDLPPSPPAPPGAVGVSAPSAVPKMKVDGGRYKTHRRRKLPKLL